MVPIKNNLLHKQLAVIIAMLMKTQLIKMIIDIPCHGVTCFLFFLFFIPIHV